ncbi:MAG: HlyD family efflux transporter periplasmic adaptor subunit, partial [Bacillota bacterium]
PVWGGPRAPRAGVVTCQVDGLEGVLNPDQVDILEVAGTKLKADETAGRDNGKNKCQKGQPVMKIIDNLSPLAICLQVPDGFPPDRIKKDGGITLAWENNEFTGRIADVRDRGGRPEVIIKTFSYPSGLLYKRKVLLALVGGTVSGCLVPTKSLVEREGQRGIYIMNKQQFRWVPVKVEGEVNGSAAVSGEHIVPGTRYAVNPRWFFTGN